MPIAFIYAQITPANLEAFFQSSVWPVLQSVPTEDEARGIIEDAIVSVEARSPTEEQLDFLYAQSEVWLDAWRNRFVLQSITGPDPTGRWTTPWSTSVRIAVGAAIAIPVMLVGWLIWDRYSY